VNTQARPIHVRQRAACGPLQRPLHGGQVQQAMQDSGHVRHVVDQAMRDRVIRRALELAPGKWLHGRHGFDSTDQSNLGAAALTPPSAARCARSASRG